jgi:hypothetical protein
MTPERCRRITDVFHFARAHDVGAHAAILDEACAGDLTLRGDVEEMLAGDDQAGQFGDRLSSPLPRRRASNLGRS